MKRAAIFLLVCWCISSYHLNYVMMKNGVGFYNNDPQHVWHEGGLESGVRRQGPSGGGRHISFWLSPITAVLSGVQMLMDSTIPPETDNE